MGWQDGGLATLRQWFAEFTKTTGETPTHIVLDHSDYWYNERWPIQDGELVEFASLGPDVMDREFDDGYGRQEAPNITAWSETWVITTHEYDGSESLQWSYRNPTSG